LPDLALAASPRGAALARGAAIQVRVNAETLRPDGTFGPSTGTLRRFQPPAGRGVRVDTAGYPGYAVSPHYDPLLAKVITDGGTLEEAARRAVRALADIAGVPTNVAWLQALLRAVLQAPGPGLFDVGWVDAHAAELVAAEPQEGGPGSPAEQVLPGHTVLRAPLAGTVVSVTAAPGDLVAPGDELVVIEAMKMEHEVRAQAAGLVHEVPVTTGATAQAGDVLVVLAGAADATAGPSRAGDVPLDHVRPDLARNRGPRGPAGALRGAGRRAVHPRQGAQYRHRVRDRRRDRPGRHPRRAHGRPCPGRPRGNLGLKSWWTTA
jgi:acetyl/propionyl-CoA carboxylase alpha subunit